MQEQTNKKAGDKPGAPYGKKKPYRKPAYRCERVFETMALACGKTQSSQGSCHFNRKFS
jgi:hypothetical protein